MREKTLWINCGSYWIWGLIRLEVDKTYLSLMNEVPALGHHHKSWEPFNWYQKKNFQLFTFLRIKCVLWFIVYLKSNAFKLLLKVHIVTFKEIEFIWFFIPILVTLLILLLFIFAMWCGAYHCLAEV